MPDYQGIGLGIKLLNFVAEYYSSKGYDVSIKTSAKNLIMALKNKNNWLLQSYGFAGCSNKKSAIDYKRSTIRTNAKAASFFYKR